MAFSDYLAKTRYKLFTDFSGTNQVKIYQELSNVESTENYKHCRFKWSVRQMLILKRWGHLCYFVSSWSYSLLTLQNLYETRCSLWMAIIAVGTIVVGSLRLSFWDLGGQEELQSLWHKYFEDSQALIFVVDSCDPDRFPEVGEAFSKFMIYILKTSHQCFETLKCTFN